MGEVTECCLDPGSPGLRRSAYLFDTRPSRGQEHDPRWVTAQTSKTLSTSHLYPHERLRGKVKVKKPPNKQQTKQKLKRERSVMIPRVNEGSNILLQPRDFMKTSFCHDHVTSRGLYFSRQWGVMFLESARDLFSCSTTQNK